MRKGKQFFLKDISFTNFDCYKNGATVFTDLKMRALCHISFEGDCELENKVLGNKCKEIWPFIVFW